MSLLLNSLLSYSIYVRLHTYAVSLKMLNSFECHIFFHAHYIFHICLSIRFMIVYKRWVASSFRNSLKWSDMSVVHLFTHLSFPKKKNNTPFLDKSSFYRVESVRWCVYFVWLEIKCVWLFFRRMLLIQCCTVQKNQNPLGNSTIAVFISTV